MRALVAACALACGSLAHGANASAQETAVRVVDTTRSHAVFSVTHLYVEQVEGSIPILAASVTLGADGVPTAFEATLDPRHVSTDSADRDDDLQGPDWFDTARFPTWTFRSQSIVRAGDGFSVMGPLVVHGVAQTVTLSVTRAGDRFMASGHIDRHGFGMRQTPIDGLIGTDVALKLDVTLRATK